MVNRFFAQLFESDKPSTEGELWYFKLFELFVGAYVIRCAWKWAAYIPRNSEVVQAHGIGNYIDLSFMFGDILPLINAGLITLLCILAFLRMGSRWQYLLCLLLLHFQYAARFSQGKIPHGMNMIGMSLLVLALAVLIFKKPWKVSRFTFGSVYFFVGLSYISAAFSKLIGTGFNWFDGRHLWLWIAEKGIDILSRTGNFDPNFLQELALASIPLASIFLLLGWLVEFSGVFIWWKKTRPYVVTAIIAMHLGITVTMNIRFDTYILELLIIGYPWDLLLNKYADRLPKLKALSFSKNA